MQGIEFQIVNDSAGAVRGIEELTRALGTLKSSVGKGGSSLNTVAKNIGKIRDATSGLNTAKLTALGDALNALKGQTEGLKISSSIGNQLKEIGTAVNSIPDTARGKLQALADGLQPLSELGKQQLGPFLNQLKKLPEVVTALDSVDIGKFADQMQQLAAAMKPFADEMANVASGFAAFPSRVQRLITSTEKYNGAVRSATSGTTGWGRALKTVSFAAVFKGASSFLAKTINKASEYTEALNMFSVSMGAYGKEAYDYAQQVSEVMGIDPATWMENQGVFNSIITGFGVAEDKAATMSKNLTQLAYDLSSFYNIGIEDAMQKVQSGISGELEPLRRLGYDLSVARLQQEAYNLGIEKNVSEMTQAEKAQLRYHAMLTQVTMVQGDMARTLEQPANQLRVLKAQVEQASRAFGNLFIPILNAVLPVAVAVVQALREIINAVGELFGVEMADSVEWGDEFSGAASATGEIADGMDDAASSAKKLKSYMMGFDELNVINPNDSSGADSSAGSSFDLEPIGYDFLGEAVTERIDAIRAKLEPFVSWIRDNLSDIVELVEAVGVGLAAWTIGKGIMNFITALKGFSADGLTPLVGVAISLAGAFIMAKNAMDAWQNGIDWENLKGMIAGVAVVVAGLSMAFGVVGAAIGLLIGGLALLTVGFHEWITTGELSTETLWTIQLGLLAVGGAIALLTGSWIPLVIAGVVAFAVEIYKNIDSIKAAFSTALDKIKSAFRTAFTWIGNFVKTILNGIIGRVEGMINRVISAVNSLLDGFNRVVSWAGDVLGKDWSGVQLLPTITLPRLANGGMVDAGQMFIAREAGPELVGTIGNRTAVANNEQIVESVAGGVREANDEQNRLLREQNELLRAILEKNTGVVLDGKTLLRSTERASRARGAVIMAGGVTG